MRDDVEPVFNFFLLDTHFTPTTSGFPTLFTNGVAADTPWFHLTPDIQILDPAEQYNAPALLVGIRARLSF